MCDNYLYELNNFNPTINRTVVIDNIEKSGKQLLIFSMEKNIGFNKYLVQEENELKKALKATVVRMPKITFCTVKEAEEDDKVRIVLTDNDRNIVLKGNISHLIKGKETDKKIFSQDENFDLIISVEKKKEIYELIRNVIFDIQLYYWFAMDIKYGHIVSKERFSLEKKEFCEEKGLLNTTSNVRYVSLAMFAYDDGKFNYSIYVGLWEEFDKYLKNKYGKQVDKIDDCKDLACEILKRHPKGKQISARALTSQISEESKSFIVVRTEKKPKQKNVRKIISGMFGCKKWKTGIVKVRRFEDRFLYMKYFPYVSVFVVMR